MKRIMFVVVVVGLVAMACSSDPEVPEPTEQAGIANPASVYCEENGGTEENRTSADGEYGVCVFEDGSECESFAFMREECAPGDNPEGVSGPA